MASRPEIHAQERFGIIRSRTGCGAKLPSFKNSRRARPDPPRQRVARLRVLGIQTKLHRWATDDPDRRFDDLYNLVCDPAFLLVTWRRVRGNKGARAAGVDGQTAHAIEAGRGVAALFEDCGPN
jgi:retron-type reverse transcriptase